MSNQSSPPPPDRASPTLPAAPPPDAGRSLAVPDAPVAHPPARAPVAHPPARAPVAHPPGSIAEMLHNRRHRTSGWTPIRVAGFIDRLGETGSVTRAAAYVRLSTVACYALRNHPDGAPFAAAWDDAVGARHEMLADLALDRVRDGVERNRWHQGQLVGVDRVFSDRLLMFMLDRTDPHRRTASGGRRRAATRGDDDPGALDRLLGGPDAAEPGTAAVPLAGPGAVDDDEDPAAEIAAALAAEFVAENAWPPEHEAATAAFVARLEAQVAAGKAEQAAFDAKVDALLHPDRAAK